MKKYLLNSIVVFALTIGSATMAWADNVVYGLTYSYTYGARTTSVDLDKVNNAEALKVTPEFGYDDAQDVICGTTADDKYFAFVKVPDPVSYDENVTLATFNFTTGNVVVVNDFSYVYSKPGYNVSGMTYDKQSKTLYATEVRADDDGNYFTDLYSVDQETGSMTLVGSFAGQYNSIAADGKGGFYLVGLTVDGEWNTYPELYKASSSFEVTKVVANTTLTSSNTSCNSLVAGEDGKTVYFLTGKNVIVFDTEASTTTLKGTLSDAVYGASYGKSSADGTHNEKPATKKKRFLVEKWTYGSSMGDISDDVVSKKYYYNYNTDGKLINEGSIARMYNSDGSVSDTFSPYYWTKVNFDENANIASTDVYQWGPYDYDDYAWQKTTSTTTYTYNEDGKVASETSDIEVKEYTYNEDGTLKSVKISSKNSGQWLQTITYSNYDGNGNALHYESDGAYDLYKYSAELQYDNDGNKVEEYRYTTTVDPNSPEYPITTPQQYETWTYENNVPQLYEKFVYDEKQEQVPAYKTEYTAVDGNPDIIQEKSYSYTNGNWYNDGRPERSFYTDFTGMEEMTAMQSLVEVNPELKNTVDVMFTIPQMASSSGQNTMFVIYRDGLPVDSLVNPWDMQDGTGQTITYQDKDLKNGSHTYFVQAKFAPNSGVGPLDAEDGESTDELEWTGYYSTMPQDVEVYTELPAVTDLAVASARKEVKGNALTGKQTTYYPTISWKNPENAEQLGFLKNSIFFENAGVAEKDTADINATKAEITLYEDDKIYIVTSYKYGKVQSETLELKIADIDKLTTAIKTVSNGDNNISFNGRNITLGNNANISVFTLNGQKVSESNNVNSITLDAPAATYIITVEKDGKVNAYKYSVK